MSLTLLAVPALMPSVNQTQPPERQVPAVERRANAARDPTRLTDLDFFSAVDQDSSGFLEEAEFANSTVRTERTDCDGKTTVVNRDAELAELDADGDKRVSRAEYRAWFDQLLDHPSPWSRVAD